MIQRKSQIWIMWALASLFYAYQYVLRVLPNIMMEDILTTFQIDAAIFGQYVGIYYIGYVLSHIPIGLLLDRVGPRIILPLCVLLTTAGLLPLIYADSWIMPTVGRILIGIGSSGAILGVFKVIRMSFVEGKFTRMLGLSVTIGLVGAIYGGGPVLCLLKIFGWRTVLQMICTAGLLLAFLMYVFVAPYSKKQTAQVKITQQIKEVFSNKMVWLVCILAGCMLGPMEGFADAWGSQFLVVVQKVSPEVAASLSSLIFLGMCFGGLFLSYVADRYKCYYGVIITSSLVMAAGFFGLFFMSLTVGALSALFWIVGIFCAYQIPAIYKASSYVSAQNVGLTTAAANMIIMAFGYIFHSAIGGFMDACWTGGLHDGVRVYEAKTYIQGLLIVPFGLLVGGIGFLFLRRRKVGPR